MYNTDISALMPRCTGLSTVDCFAFIREGFCEHYATTMTMLMRMAGLSGAIRARLPAGGPDPHSLIEQVTSQQKHAWVEVYFPTYGWIPFDPTGGGVGVPTQSFAGERRCRDAYSDLDTYTGRDRGAETPTSTPTSGAGGDTTTPNSGQPIFLVPAILVGDRLARPVRPVAAQAADVWTGRMPSIATSSGWPAELGYKPQPTQTVYEYTGMLADVVPQARDLLGVVAMATVEVTYGRRQLSSERLVFLATAHRMVRQALLRLAFRLPRLRGAASVRVGRSRAKARSGRSRS